MAFDKAPAGMDLGSGATFMPQFYAAERYGSTAVNSRRSADCRPAPDR